MNGANYEIQLTIELERGGGRLASNMLDFLYLFSFHHGVVFANLLLAFLLEVKGTVVGVGVAV